MPKKNFDEQLMEVDEKMKKFQEKMQAMEEKKKKILKEKKESERRELELRNQKIATVIFDATDQTSDALKNEEYMEAYLDTLTSYLRLGIETGSLVLPEMPKDETDSDVQTDSESDTSLFEKDHIGTKEDDKQVY